MVVYTNSHMADMHFCYGLADGNSANARRLYAERYPDRQVPHHSLFQRIHQRLAEQGSFKARMHDAGRNRVVRTEALEEAVLNFVEDHPESSTRKIAETFNTTKSVVWLILKENLLYPFHIQRVQALLPRDFPLRINFCNWVLQKILQNPTFLTLVFFTDEACFSRNAIMNFHNKHVWAEENPHETVESRHQQQFSLNVWLGQLENYLIGPFFLPTPLNAHSYRHFLEEELPILLEDVPLQLRRQAYFMHDGAPAHFGVNVREYLNLTYRDHWIGRGGPQAWPPRSPDLNPLDFSLWGHLKSLVYTTPILDIIDLRNRIVAACNDIRNTPGIFDRIRRSLRQRVDSCILVGGGHFQHLI